VSTQLRYPVPFIAGAREMMAAMGLERVVLREERSGADVRHLWAYLDDAGALHIDGQDLGPATAPVSDDGEYEWYQVISAADVPRLKLLLGAEEGTGILEILSAWTGERSYELERRLRESSIPVRRHVW
jgi:hypothetical protein